MKSTRLINPAFGGVWAFLAFGFIIAPLLVVLMGSLTAANFISFPWNEGFSLRWYRDLPDQPEFLAAARNSAVLAVYATLIGAVVGSLAALAIVRYRIRARGLVELLGTSPLFVPQVMTGLAIAIALPAWGIVSGFPLLLVGHVLVTIPYVLRVVCVSLVGLDPRLEWAAMDLGATRLQVFRLVVLPQILPGIVAGSIMGFIVSVENISMSLFLAGPGFDVLPVALYNFMVESYTPLASSISVILLLVVALAMGLTQRVAGLDKVFGGEVK